MHLHTSFGNNSDSFASFLCSRRHCRSLSRNHQPLSRAHEEDRLCHVPALLREKSLLLLSVATPEIRRASWGIQYEPPLQLAVRKGPLCIVLLPLSLKYQAKRPPVVDGPAWLSEKRQPCKGELPDMKCT